MIQFASGTVILFSQRGTVKMKFKQFSEFGTRTELPEWLVQRLYGDRVESYTFYGDGKINLEIV